MRKIITKAIALLIAFSTVTLAQEKGSFTDARDKKTYKTVKIGEQVWMAENLNYADKDSKCNGERGTVRIPDGPNVKVVTLSKTEFEANCKKYGRLYDWETAMKACPSGWHLPSNKEWQTLVDFAGGDDIAGKKLKSKSDWVNGNGTDDYGFSALPSGDGTNGAGYFNGSWRSSTEDGRGRSAYKWNISNGNRVNNEAPIKSFFTSVRCVQSDANYAKVAKAEAEEKAAKEKAEAEAKEANEKAAKEKAEAEAAAKTSGGTFTDTRDKKTYKTIKINGQVWLAENLNYAAENSKCYEDKPENCTKYGRLYNWETAAKSCPAGWHLPKNEEWDKLYRTADGGTSGTKSPYSSQTAGIFLKATNGWDNVDNKGTSGNGTDNFGFSALPGGDAVMQSNKLKFSSIGYDGNWWSSTNNNDNAYWTSISTRIMGSKRFDFTQFQEGNKKSFYMSVRCIKD